MKKANVKGIVLLLVIIIISIAYIKKSTWSKEQSSQIIDESEINIGDIEYVEDVVVETAEPIEDVQIKELVEKIKLENNLNEENFSFFYYNIDQQSYYFYNENTYYTAASTIKMPIAMLYYDKVSNGEISLNDTIVYTSDCYEAGAGTIASTYSINSKVPINILLEQSIVNSDNTATNMLIKNLGYKNCRTQIANYSNVELPEKFYSSNIISAKYAYDVVNYLYENMQNYEELITYLKKSSNGEYLKKYIDDYDVAHKYGSYNGYVHDYGIVFGENTYLIGIFTKNVSNADELIAEISLDVLNEI